MANNQTINVGIKFNADTSAAKQSIKDLEATLGKLGQTDIGFSGGSIDHAVQSVRQLETALKSAVNVNTGKLDFSKLNASLKAMGTDVTIVSAKLISLGPEGQKAFAQLSNAIANTELPAKRLNGVLMKFGDTLIRTIRWQVASSMIHGFMSTVSSAVSYIENLDKSLNSIQIVTQKNGDEMARFAKQANALAGELSAVTKEYTDASLIFFQQGLDTDEVIERTNATIKLAKVTGESVEQISSQLTAIWNNFDDGTKDLEYYADVITALGAATASSSDEISQGLSKFAAVADTVGLSYERATAALATVVAETRQSADIVGTSFRTIFARIEGLSLGETLEDGVTLNKYSEALAKVGVDILNQEGELKSMDNILDNIARRWENLSQAQKVALSQTVAGVRQYSQFLALMENYDKVRANEEIARDSEGTLEKQFNVYQDSIEALNTELKKAKQDVFDSLLNDEQVKGYKQLLIDVLGFLKNVSEGFGGIKGIISSVGMLLLSNYLPQIEARIGNIFANLRDGLGFTQRQQEQILDKQLALTEGMIQKQNSTYLSDPSKVDVGTESLETVQLVAQRELLLIRKQINEESRNYTELQRQQAQYALEMVTKAGDELIAGKEQLEQGKERLRQLQQEQERQEAIARGRAMQVAKNSYTNSLSGFTQGLINGQPNQEEREQLRNNLATQLNNNFSAIRKGKNEGNNNLVAELERQNTVILAQLKLLQEFGQITDGNYEKVQNLTRALAEQSKISMTQEEIESIKNGAIQQSMAQSPDTYSFMDDVPPFGEGGNLVELLTTLEGAKEAVVQMGENAEITGENYDRMRNSLVISRENMERLAKASGQFSATSKVTQGIMSNISVLQKNQAGFESDKLKGTKEYAKAQEEIKSQQKIIVNQAQQLVNQLENNKVQSSALKTEITTVKDAIANINEPGGLENLQIALQALQKAAGQSSMDIEMLARTMAEDFSGGDRAAEAALNAIISNLKLTTEQAEELKRKFQEFREIKIQNPLDGAGNLKEGFNALVSGTSQLSMGLKLATSGFDEFTDSIAKGGSFLQKFTSFVMLARGATMALQGATALATAAKKIHNAVVAAGIAIAQKDEKAIQKNTLARAANAIATIFQKEASKGWIGVIAGVAAAGIVAATIGITAHTVALKKQAEQRKKDAESAAKQAEESSKAAKTAKEEYEAVKQLSEEQQELYQEYLNTNSGKQDLYESTKHLLEELDREDLMLDLLAGRYEKINAELEKTIALKRKEAAASAANSAEQAEEAYQSELEASENGLVLNSEGNIEFLSAQDANIRDYLIKSLNISDYGISNEKLQEELQKIYGDNLIFNGASLSYKNTKDGFEAYKKFQEESAKQYKEILGKEKEKDSAKKQFYDYVNSILPEGEGLEFGENFDVLMLMNLLEDKEGYDANTFSHYYDAYFGKEIEEDVYKGVRNRFSQNTDSEAYKLGEASAEEYSNAVNAGFNSYLEDSGILKAESVEEIFDIINSNIDQDGEIKNSSPFVNYLSEIMGIDIDAAKEYIEKFLPDLYNLMLGANKDLAELAFVKDKRKDDINFAEAAEAAKISEKEMNSLLIEANVDFNTVSSTEDLADLLNLLQEQANNEPIEITANLAKEASKGWKKNMEYLDIKDWLDKYSSLFTEEELNNFLNSSYEQQTAILDRMFSPEAFQKASADRIAQLQEYQNQWAQGFYNDGKGAKSISIQDYLKNATGIEADSDILNMIQNGFEVPDDHRGKFAFAQKLLDENGITIEQYQQLVEIYNQLASAIDSYDTELKELEEDQRLLDELGPATAFNAKVNALGLDRDEISDIEKEIPNLVDQYDDLADSLKTDADAAREVALAIKQTDKGLDDLVKNYDDWKEVLSGKDDVKKIEVMKDLKKSLADIMNITDELQEAGMTLGNHFGDYLLEHMDLVKKAADGDKDAILELQKVAAEDILLQIKTDLNIKPEDYDELKNKVLGTMQDIQSMLDNNELQIGAIEDGPLMASLNNIINSIAMTSDQAQALLATMGFDAEVETVPQKKVASYYRYPTFRPEPIEAGGDTIGYNLVEDQDSGGWQKVEGFEETTALKIKTAKYVGGGNIVTRSGGTGRYSNSGKSGGGGGGGSRSKKEPKKANDEIERYHVIDKTIDSLSKKYSRLSAAKDAAFGAQRLKYIERENKLLQEQYEAEKQRLKEVEDYYAKDRGAIEAYGAVIDENGIISNYEQIMQAQLDKYNAAVTSYNAGSMTDEAFEVIEKEYEEFKKILSQFEETNSEWLEQLQKVEDAIREQIAAELDAIKIKVEVELELPNEQLKIIEFKLKTLEDRAFVTSERLALFGEQAQLAADSFETYADAFKKVLTMEVTDAEGNKTGGFGLTEDQANRLLGGDLSVIEEAGITGENAQAIMDALKEYEDNLIDEYNKLADARKQMWEELNNMIDEYSEAIDNQIDRMEKLGNIAKNIKTLIGTLGKETMGVTADIMNSINESILSSSRNQIEALGSSIAAWETSLAEAKDKLAQAIAENDQDAIDEWNKVIQTLEDKIIEGKERMLSQINDFVEQAAEILQEQVKESFDNLARQMYGMTMDDAIASYDRYKTLSEDYLKDYQKIYELSKLTRNIENSINNTDNIRAKERLRDLQEEINKYQAEGVKMTQYEVDYLTKKYELRQAEIALEEAQNATDKVRLSRNADGGWGYVYTANQENIDQAQQNYEDRLYALQQLNQQAIEDSQSTILQLQKEFEDQILETISDTSLTEEERQAKIEELQQYYLARQQVYYDTLDSALAHNQELYRQDWTEYNRLTGYRISADNDYVDNFNETWMGTNGIGAGVESVQRAFEVYQTTLGKYDDGEGQTVLGSTYTRISNYVTAVRNILTSLGTALNGEEGGPSVGQSIADEIGKINSALSNASTAVQGLITELETNLPSAMTDLANAIGGDNGIDNTLNSMQGVIENVNGAVQGLITSLTNLGNIDASPTINNPVPSAGNVSSSSISGQGNGGSGEGGSSGGSGGILRTPSFQTYYQIVLTYIKNKKQEILKTEQSETAARNMFEQYKNKYKKLGNIYEKIELIKQPNNQTILVYYIIHGGGTNEDINTRISMATGGYTGSFGPDGRMAILHEKELVLNKQDTQNVLQMVAMAREALGQPVNLPLSSIGAIKASFKNQNNNGLGLQEVHIEAHFPNVVNHLEIEEALRNLANYTAQNAYNFDFSNRVNIF